MNRRPACSLDARILWQMAVRIAVVIALVTLASYWHVVRSASGNEDRAFAAASERNADGKLVSHPDEAVMAALRDNQSEFSIPQSGDAAPGGFRPRPVGHAHDQHAQR